MSLASPDPSENPVSAAPKLGAGTPITDPEVIRFVNEQIRPLCELARALKAMVLSMHAAWTGGIGAKCPGDASAIADNRDGEGASRLTGYVVGVAHDTLLAVANAVNDAYINPPCVRPLTVLMAPHTG